MVLREDILLFVFRMIFFALSLMGMDLFIRVQFSTVLWFVRLRLRFKVDVIISALLTVIQISEKLMSFFPVRRL